MRVNGKKPTGSAVENRPSDPFGRFRGGIHQAARANLMRHFWGKVCRPAADVRDAHVFSRGGGMRTCHECAPRASGARSQIGFLAEAADASGCWPDTCPLRARRSGRRW